MSSVQCYACLGNGIKEKKVKGIDKKWIRQSQQCNACQGKGNIIRTKRKNDDGICYAIVSRRPRA